MSVLTLPAPTVPDAADDSVDHYVCCDKNVSLCGVDVSDEPIVVGSDRSCPLCVLLLNEPCGVPGCQG